MEPVSLIAIALAVIVAAIGMSRAAAARRELDEAKREIARLEKQLAAPEEEPAEVEEEKGEAPEDEEEGGDDDEEDEEDEVAAEEPEAARAEKPAIDPSVAARAEAMLRDALNLARHIGFDHEVTVGDEKGVRVTVVIEDDIDESAFSHLCATSDVVLDSGIRGDDRFLVIRR